MQSGSAYNMPLNSTLIDRKQNEKQAPIKII
jgi:hypothetical protein